MTPTWLNLDDTKPLRALKEVLFEGVVWKDGKAHPFPEPILNRLASSVHELITDGIAIPFTLGHDDWTNPKNRLGKIVGAEVSRNDKDQPALFVGVDFVDEKARDIALNAEVSIGYDPLFSAGNGKRYDHVIRHVASTNAAVVGGLSDWREWPALAASFGFEVENTYMSKILEHLGVADEDAALEAIKKLQEKPAEKVELSYPDIVISTLRDARIANHTAMVTSGEISPAVKGELDLAFANENTLTLELSHNSSDSYEQTLKLVKLASKSQPVSPTGRSTQPTQDGVELSHDGGETWLDRFKKWAEQQKQNQ